MAANEEKIGIEFNYLPGFGSLADFVASDGDRSTAVYKRFDRLAARNLLYYQSELAELQALQDEYDIQDAKDVEDLANPDSWEYARNQARDWISFRGGGVERPSLMARPSQDGTPAQLADDRRRRRMQLAMDIRQTLKDYREALIQESTLLSMRQPSKQTMAALSSYFHTRTTSTEVGQAGMSTYPTLTGASSHLYPGGMGSSDIRSSDYISLSQQPESDLLTHFLKTYCSRLFRTAPPSMPAHDQGVSISHLPRHQVVHYSIGRVRFVASFITTLTAALLLFLPIYALYQVSSSRQSLALGLIALFTIMFACAIVAMTNARRAEVFGACAAYAAVLVVFVSGDFKN